MANRGDKVDPKELFKEGEHVMLLLMVVAEGETGKMHTRVVGQERLTDRLQAVLQAMVALGEIADNLDDEVIEACQLLPEYRSYYVSTWSEDGK